MGIETKYAYKYYTVIDFNRWQNGNESIWETDEGISWHVVIEFINTKFKNSDDKSVNKYRVDYAGYERDIEDWIRIHEKNKDLPVFVQFQDNQPIMRTGEGSLFVLYEESDDYQTTNSGYTNNYSWSRQHDEDYSMRPDIDEGSVDGLARYGRL